MNSSTLPTANHSRRGAKGTVYVTFTGTAVVLTLESHSETLTAG
jgi:hypothetical protein